eukprot:4130291-Ditylum_brightwellii.AAC.1
MNRLEPPRDSVNSTEGNPYKKAVTDILSLLKHREAQRKKHEETTDAILLNRSSFSSKEEECLSPQHTTTHMTNPNQDSVMMTRSPAITLPSLSFPSSDSQENGFTEVDLRAKEEEWNARMERMQSYTQRLSQQMKARSMDSTEVTVASFVEEEDTNDVG